MNVNFSPAEQRADEAEYLGHSNEHLALQQHSIDGFYPWSVVCRYNAGTGKGYHYPKNLISGDCGRHFGFDRAVDGDWGRSYDLAEQWIRNHKGIADPTTNQPTAANVV